MNPPINILKFLMGYDVAIQSRTLLLREVLVKNLPNITEQLDLPARMIGYCYGQKYDQLICTIIPSKKGLKLGFNKGPELPDPGHLLAGTGKISRYVELKTDTAVKEKALAD